MWGSLLRHRPAVLLLLAAITGIVVADGYNLPVLQLIGLCVFCSVLALISLRRAAWLSLTSIVVAAAALFALLLTGSRNCEHSTIARIADLKPQGVLLRGKISDAETYDDGYRWIVNADSLSYQSATVRHPLPVHARILIWAHIAPLESQRLHPYRSSVPQNGDIIQIFTDLRGVRDATNPYEASRERALQRRLQVDAIAEVHSVFDYTILRREGGALSSVAAAIDSVRSLFLRRIEGSIHDHDTRAFVEAVVLGERSKIDHDVYEDFTRAGISHILAVSGFNVGIVALVIAQLLRFLGVINLRIRTVVVMFAAVAYGALVGFEPSVVRALVMIELYLLSVLLERRRDPVNIIAFAALLGLLIRPNDLFDVGFQLTYSCVIGLAVVTPELRRLLLPARWESRPKLLREAVEMVLLSLGATLASLPVVVIQFHRVSIAGVLTNFPAIPLSSLITALGFLLIPIASASHWLGVLYGQAEVLLTRTLMLATSFMASLPSASEPIPRPTWTAVILSIMAIVYLLRSSDKSAIIKRTSVALAASFCIIVSGIPLTHRTVTASGKLTVLVDDVGQGDCIFLRTPRGKNYLIDCGPISRSGTSRIESTLLPILRSESYMHLDGIFLSHMHRDHYGGAPAIVSNCDVDAIYTSGERHADPVARTLDSVVKRERVRCRVLQRGDRIELDSGVILYVLHPGSKGSTRQLTSYGLNANAGSLAFKICYGRTSYLFLGDIERSEEELLKDEYGSFLQSSVVKVAHHGSLTSSSKLFAGMVHPEWAVISVGDNNRFGHPAAAIVRRWAGLGARVARTDRDGAVLFESDGRSVSRIDWQRRDGLY